MCICASSSQTGLNSIFHQLWHRRIWNVVQLTELSRRLLTSDHRLPCFFMLGGNLKAVMLDASESEALSDLDAAAWPRPLETVATGARLTLSSILVRMMPKPGVTHPPQEQRRPVQANLPMLELHFLFGQVKRPSILPSANTSRIHDKGCKKMCAHCGGGRGDPLDDDFSELGSL